MANSLPYPLDSIPRHGWGNKRSQRDAMDLIPFMKEFNQERLQVTNLEKGHYRLTIDGLFIDNVSSGQLEDGINLADYPNTPQYQQAMKIIKEYLEPSKQLQTMKNTWRQTFVYQLLLDFNTSNLLFGGSQKSAYLCNAFLPRRILRAFILPSRGQS